MADSDILLQAWLRWAEDCLDRIVGDYAFAAFSTRKPKV
jgi:asparagine synthetase B (glutamine-hydrolysing)